MRLACPFRELGCQHELMEIDCMNLHLKNDNYSHSKLLVECVCGLREELTRCKEAVEENEARLGRFGESCLTGVDRISSIEEEIRVVNERVTAFEGKCRPLAQVLLDESNARSQDIVRLTQDLDDRREDMARTESHVSQVERSLGELKAVMESFSPTFVWRVDRVSERRAVDNWIFSEYFFTRNTRYKLRLRLRLNNCFGTGLSLFLRVYDSSKESTLFWPFRAQVSMTIVARAADVSETVFRLCAFDKPDLNCNCSDSFDFHYVDLEEKKLIIDDVFVVRCNVIDL